MDTSCSMHYGLQPPKVSLFFPKQKKKKEKK